MHNESVRWNDEYMKNYKLFEKKKKKTQNVNLYFAVLEHSNLFRERSAWAEGEQKYLIILTLLPNNLICSYLWFQTNVWCTQKCIFVELLGLDHGFCV